MELENVLYGGVQLVHNFGAAAVTGLPFAALWSGCAGPPEDRLAHPACLAVASCEWRRLRHRELLHGRRAAGDHLARAALYVKIGCAALAIALPASHFARRVAVPGPKFWAGLAVLGVTALSCAAVLRWFS